MFLRNHCLERPFEYQNSISNLSLWLSVMGAAIALQKVLEYILQNEKNCGQNEGLKVAHHCFRSLLEVMVDLKELQEMTGSEETESESESEEDDEADEADESDEVFV